jgi:hypothetical protein
MRGSRGVGGGSGKLDGTGLAVFRFQKGTWLLSSHTAGCDKLIVSYFVPHEIFDIGV